MSGYLWNVSAGGTITAGAGTSAITVTGADVLVVVTEWNEFRALSPARLKAAMHPEFDWSRPAEEVDRRLRGLSPFPGAWFEMEGPRGPLRVKALLSRAELGSGAPGVVLDAALLVACGEGAVRLLRLQREGKGPQAADEFLRGAPVAPGVRLA